MDKQEWTARVMAAAQLLKANGYADVAGLLARTELAQRRKPTNRPRKVRLATPDGKPVTGKRAEFWIDAERLHDAVEND